MNTTEPVETQLDLIQSIDALRNCSTPSLYEMRTYAIEFFKGAPQLWLIHVLETEIVRRRDQFSEFGMVQIPMLRWSIEELCDFAQRLHKLQGSSIPADMAKFVDQCFEQAFSGVTGSLKAYAGAFNK
jgi:hypothetical protein